MSTEFGNRPEMQSNGAEPVIENPKLLRMGEKAARPRRIGGQLRMMDDNPQSDTSGKGSMGKFSRAKSRGKTKKALPDQTAPKMAKARGGGESYIRMRVRVENGQMSVIDMRQVDGPLAMLDTITSGYVAEVSLNQQRIAIDSIPDLGTQRAYIDPNSPAGRQGVHGVSPMTSVEFNVRVPSGALTLRALPKAEIALYQVKDVTRPKAVSGVTTLDVEFSRELREIARLKGIRIDSLPKEVQQNARRAFK